MYNEQIEALISAALTDGVLTEKEKQILFKKAQSMGIDLDEFEMVLDARLVQLKKEEKEKADKSAPKSNKYGDVRKCPVCGALVPALAGACAECGYEFSNVETNFSSAKLSKLLLEAENAKYNIQKGFWEDLTMDSKQYQHEIDKLKNKAKKQVIEQFPVPMTKADLFDFMHYVKPHIKWGKLSRPYRKKMSECLSKARMLYSKDVDFEKLIIDVERDLNIRKWTILGTLIAIVTCILITMGVLMLRPKDATNNASVCNKEVLAFLEQNDFISAKQTILKYNGKPYKIITSYKMAIEKGIELGYQYDIVKLINNYETFNNDTYTDLEESYKVTSLIRAGRYEDAERRLTIPESDFWNGTSKRNEVYYQFLSQCVSDMSTKGEKAKAKQYINKKVSFFASEPKKYEYSEKKNQYYIETVRSNLNALLK